MTKAHGTEQQFCDAVGAGFVRVSEHVDLTTPFDTVPVPSFLLNAALPAAGAALLFLFGRRLTRALDAASVDHIIQPSEYSEALST